MLYYIRLDCTKILHCNILYSFYVIQLVKVHNNLILLNYLSLFCCQKFIQSSYLRYFLYPFLCMKGMTLKVNENYIINKNIKNLVRFYFH